MHFNVRSIRSTRGSETRASRLNAAGAAVRVVYVPFHFSEPAGLYSQAIAQYHKEHPDVSVSLKQVKRHGVAGPADVLLGAVDPVATETVGRFLMYIPLYVCVGLDHPLVWRKTVQLADLDPYRCAKQRPFAYDGGCFTYLTVAVDVD